MRSIDVLKALGVVVSIAVASSAYAQASDAMQSSGEMAASAPTNTKATRRADRKLGADVRRAMARTQGLNVSNVFVRARSGAVTLTGSVPDASQIDRAGEVAKTVSGVTSVSNKITVSPQRGGGG
jgi:osmotically-inducible protein OsmY